MRIDDQYILELPVIVKALTEDKDRRIISFECSRPEVDLEGDLIEQAALLDSVSTFLKGFCDLDHLGECAACYNLNPNDWIIGRPTRAFDMGQGRTGAEVELFKGHPKAEMVWESLNKIPPDQWFSSIYGLPKAGGVIDASSLPESERKGATRYIVKALEWRSIALTKRPVNNNITGAAHIVHQKAFMKSMQDNLPEILKSYGFVSGLGVEDVLPSAAGVYGPQELAQDKRPDGNTANSAKAPHVAPPTLHMPRNRVELMGHHTHHIAIGKCPMVDIKKSGISVAGLREHFKHCTGMDDHQADIHALATMHLLKRH